MNDEIVSTDRAPLEAWFDLDALPEPSSVQWGQRARGTGSGTVPGPTDYYVMAVLEYDEPVGDAFAGIGLAPRSDIFVEEVLLEAWLPAALTERFGATPEGYIRYDGTAYDAGPLLRSPLNTGYLLVVDRYVFLFGST